MREYFYMFSRVGQCFFVSVSGVFSQKLWGEGQLYGEFWGTKNDPENSKIEYTVSTSFCFLQIDPS